MSIDDAAVRAFLEATNGPRRRARPRMANRLLNAEHAIVEGVATWRTGPGPAVLLVHGWEDDNSLWDPLLEGLEQVYREAVVVDLPGHGFSPAPMTHMLDVAQRIAAVAAACGPIDAVVTHSYGGPCTSVAIEEFGLAPARVVMIAAPVVQKAQMERRAARYEAPPGAVEAMIAGIEAATGKPIDWFDLRRAAVHMKARALLVHDLADEICPVEEIQAVADVWPGAELLLTDGMGHRDVARDAGVVARIADFLA